MGNLAADSSFIRDKMLRKGCLDKLLDILQKMNPEKCEPIMWAITCLCRGEPKPQIKKVKKVLPFLIELIEQFKMRKLGK